MTIVLTGASGSIGRRLLETLLAAGHTLRVLTRRPGLKLPPGVALSLWEPERGAPPPDALRDAEAVVHLAGEPVAQRWTPEAKRRILESRVAGTRRLVEGLAQLRVRPATLICASAIGYYGARGDEILEETAAPGEGFLAEVCLGWEREAAAARALGMRVALMRTGIVLDPRGGALARMLPPFRLGVGGRLGDGRQWMSWIHADDLARLYRHAIETPLDGPCNAVAPGPVTNSTFTAELARALHRPAAFPVPAFALKAMFGEMAAMLLTGQRVVPAAALAAGFQFRHGELPAALEDLLR